MVHHAFGFKLALLILFGFGMLIKFPNRMVCCMVSLNDFKLPAVDFRMFVRPCMNSIRKSVKGIRKYMTV